VARVPGAWLSWHMRRLVVACHEIPSNAGSLFLT